MFFHQTSELTKSDEYRHAPSSSAQPVDPSPSLLFHRWRPALWGWFFLLPFCAFSTSTAFATAVPTAFSKQFSQAFSTSFGRSPCRFCRFCRASSSGGTAGSGAMFVLVVQGNLASWKRPPSERAIYSNVSMSHRLPASPAK